MVRPRQDLTYDRRSKDPKSSINAPEKKAGGGGKFTMGRPGEEAGGATVDWKDPNFDPDERRVDPDDGVAYKFDELAAYYKGKFTKQAIAEYWEYECTAVKRKSKRSAEPQESAGPTPQESMGTKPKAKVKAKAKAKVKAAKGQAKRLSPEDIETDGPLATEVAAVIPYFPFKKLEKFYDVQGLLNHPKLFNAVCAVIGKRFKQSGVTKVAAIEARGFLFAPVAVRIGVPFVMLRKAGKMPNTISSAPYTKEYEGVDTLCVQRGAIVEGDKVAVLDDLIATGGTLCAGIELIKACKAEIVECACVVEIKALNGRERCLKAGAKQVWSFISEDLLTTRAELPADYEDDGAAH